MRRLSGPALMLVAALVVVAASVPARSAVTGAAARPAEWRSFDLIVDFSDLPRRYTCNELWYRLHDVLLAIGARPYPQISIDGCGKTPAASSRSPSAHLQLQLPRALAAANVRYAQFPAASTTVRLAPGTLHHFTATDCELMRQIRAFLLPELPVQAVGAELTCPAGAPRHPFAVEVRALVPLSPPHS